MRYDHTQYAPLHLILARVGVVMFASALLVPIPAVRVVLYVAGGLVLLLAFSFRRLTV